MNNPVIEDFWRLVGALPINRPLFRIETLNFPVEQPIFS
jgi:hypothetical protein